MSETERGDQMIAESETGMRRAGWYSRIGWAVLVLVLIALVILQVRGYQMGQEREHRIDVLQEQATDSDSAATEVAQDRQSQAQSVRELCESGAIEMDDAGQAVCDEAVEVAEKNPAETIAAAKAVTGPGGPRGPAGAPGSPGKPGDPGDDGTDGGPGVAGTAGGPGTPGIPGEPGSSGEPGSPGESGDDGDDGGPGTSGKPGADGKPGTAGESGSSGSAGSKGDTGSTGTKGDTGTAGAKGDTGTTGPSGAPGTPGKDGKTGSNGRGIDTATCDPDTGRWEITYTDDTTEDAGPCIVTPETPEPTPTEEVTP